MRRTAPLLPTFFLILAVAAASWGWTTGGVDQQIRSVSAQSTTIGYFALGDSIASGHGLMDDGTYCRRSNGAYPYLMPAKLADRVPGLVVNFPAWHHLACSGATALAPDTAALAEEPNRWLSNQVDEVLKHLNRNSVNHPVLVSITIGANDLAWLNFPWDVIRMGLTAEGYLESVGTVSGSGPGASADKPTVRQAVLTQVRRLLANPMVVVVITQTHNPVNAVAPWWFSACNTIGTLDCYDRTEYAIRSLNDALFEVWADELSTAEQSRVRVTAGLQATFNAHKAPRPM